MLAAPKQKAAEEEASSSKERESEDLFSNIFAGLSFPDAPTHTFIQRKSQPAPSASKCNADMIDMIELQNTDSFGQLSSGHGEALSMEEEEPFPIAPTHAPAPPPPTYTETTALAASDSCSAPGLRISMSAVKQPQATLTAQQFDSLYGHTDEAVSSPKDVSGRSLYPSLQTLLSCPPPTTSSATTSTSVATNNIQISSNHSASYSHNPAYYEEEEEQVVEGCEETTSLLEQPQVHAQARAQDLASQQQQQLRDENERLLRELRELQAYMSNTNTANGSSSSSREAGLSSPVVISHSPRPITSSAPSQQSLLSQTRPNTAQIEQRQLQIQQQLEQNRMQSQTQAQTQAQTGAQTSNQQAALKYVCCGSCHQWLSTPRDAALVYCPGCGAVNNCNMQPAETGSAQPPPAATRPPAARRVGDSSPWYLQCVEKLF